jgi:hypothetical protein
MSVRITLLPCKSEKYYILYECVRSLRYPAGQVHGPYYVVSWRLSGCTIFFKIIFKKARFSKKKRERYTPQNVFLYKNCVWNISHSKKNSSIYYHKWPQVLMYRSHHSCQFVIKIEFRKIFKYKISWNYVRWELTCSMQSDGRTDGQRQRHDEAMSRFSKFCERSKNIIFGNLVWGRYLASARSGSSEGC